MKQLVITCEEVRSKARARLNTDRSLSVCQAAAAYSYASFVNAAVHETGESRSKFIEQFVQ